MPKLGVGLNLSVPRVGAAAPSGINVATTNAIVLSGLTGGWTDLNGTYTKSGDPANVGGGGVDGEATGAVFFNSAYTGGNRDGAAIWYGPILFGSGNGWQITWYDDNRFPLGSIVSADTTTVPVSGYSNAAGYTGTITLTAAPSGIPVASTASVIVASVASPYGEFNDTYTKKNDLEDFTSFDGYTVRSSGGVCYVSSLLKKVLVPPNVSLETDTFGSLGSRNYWSLADLLYDDGNLNWGMGVVAPFYNYTFRNDSTNASFIPQSSYYMYNRDTSATVFTSPLTITAA